MAATSPYLVSGSFTKVAPHHRSVQALWETKWRKPCLMGIYPFIDGNVEDFDIVFGELVKQELTEPYDPDTFAAAFFPVARALEEKAAQAETIGDVGIASQLYLRAAALYRIARFPIARSPKTFEAWALGKAAYMKASQYMHPNNTEVVIPHSHADISAGDGTIIQAYLRLPPPLNLDASAREKVPVVIFICGLDAYRTDHTNRTSEHVRRGFACLSVEIPGTGDCPASKHDPTSPDRLWSSILDWIETQEALFDKNKICVRSVSTGGYYGMRVAHTHAERLLAVVSQGGGSHRMFAPEWIDAQNQMEYPYALSDALAYKFGYDSVDAYKQDAQREFSLLENGIFDQKSCRLLLINGLQDEIFPVEDSMIPLEHGNVKEARFVPNAYHMGNAAGEGLVYDWLDQFK